MRLQKSNYRRFRRYRGRKMTSGKQMTDEVTGLQAYEADLEPDAYGNMVDSRHPENFDNPDTFGGGETQP